MELAILLTKKEKLLACLKQSGGFSQIDERQ